MAKESRSQRAFGVTAGANSSRILRVSCGLDSLGQESGLEQIIEGLWGDGRSQLLQDAESLLWVSQPGSQV